MADYTALPEFVESDPDVIMSESKELLEQYLGRELQPAQVEQLMLQFIVYSEVRLISRFNAGAAQMLIQFSKAPTLDYIAALVAVERLPAASAACTVRFTLVAGHGSVLIPMGTRVATVDGTAIFETVADLTIAAGINTVTVSAEAQTAGKSGNGYAPGTVTKILDPLAFVSEVTNIDETAGGSDVETDAQLVERIKLAPSQYSTAGSRASYKFHAKSANASIIDVSVDSPIPGTVLIVPLTETGSTSQQIIEDVYNACSPEHVRPLTDTVLVAAPVSKDYAIEVDVVLYEEADAAAVRDAIKQALETYATSKRQALGLDIVRSHISNTCRKGLEGEVYDATVVSPAANIVITDVEFANCTGITVNITGFNRG